MNKRALACAAGANHREHFPSSHFQIDVTKNLPRLFSIVVVCEADILEANTLRKLRQSFGSGLVTDRVFGVHELKNLGRGAQSLLKIVIELSEFSYWIVKLKHGNDECQECTGAEDVVLYLVASQQQQHGDSDGAKNIHQRRTNRRSCHRPQIRREQPLRRTMESRNLPGLHAEGFYNAVAGDGFVQNVLNISELILPAPGGGPHPPSNLSRRVKNEWQKQQQHPR